MTDKTQCSKCKVFQPLDYYKNECKQCNKCLENKRRYREQHKEPLKQYAQQYYERKKEELSDKKKETLECPICKCEVRKYTVQWNDTKKASSIKWTLMDTISYSKTTTTSTYPTLIQTKH